VVLGVGGHRGDLVRRAIVSELDDVVALIPQDQVMHLADSLDVDLDTAEGLRKVAESMGLELFVRGRVEGKGRSAKVEIDVLGPDGLLMSSAKGKAPQTRKSRTKLAKRVAQQVQNALIQLEDDDPVEGSDVLDETLEEPASPPPPAPLKVKIEEKPIVAPQPIAAGTPGPPLASPQKLLGAHAGVAVRSRNARLELSDGRRAVHETGAFPEITVRLEGRPYLGLYAAVDFGIEVGLASLERTREVSTDALHAEATLGYLFDLGIVDLGGGVGFGIDRFALGNNRVLDSSLYSYVRVAGIGQLTLLDAILIQLDAGLRPVVSTGELGDRYGQSAKALGFEAALSIAHETDIGFTYGARGTFSGYTLRFDRTDTLSATGGFDSSFSAALTIGWVIVQQP
jgi:hypothetical protein